MGMPEISRHGRVLRLVLNRPEKRNALNGALCRELAAAIEQGDQDASVGAILLSGAGKSFCSGMDLSEMLTPAEELRVVPGKNGMFLGTVVVELPPGYSDPENASTHYPVIEAFQGYPGSASMWTKTMDIRGAIAGRVAARRMRPAPALIRCAPALSSAPVSSITPAPPPPSPGPTVAPTATPAPVRIPYLDKFIVGDYILSPKVYNEFSPGNTGKSSYAFRGGIEFSLFNLPWMLEGDYRQYQYPHNQGVATPPGYAPDNPLTNACPVVGDQGCVTVIGGQGQTFVPAFTARNYNFDARLGLKVADPRIYVAVGYMNENGNYGYPNLKSVGFGLEKLPDLDQSFSLYGSDYHHPNVRDNYTVKGGPQSGRTFPLAYGLLRYHCRL